MRTIAVVNQKGGCGKTTISINLASALAELGKKTLLLDMDPQSHCAVGLAVPEEQIEQSIYDLLISKSRNETVKVNEIVWQVADKFELAPASIDLSAFEQQLAGVPERENCLKKLLAEVKDSYDFVVVDCPPAVGLLTFNALKAATDVLVPVETGYFSLHGLSKQLETLDILCGKSNQNINVRVVASMYDIRTKMAREIMAELRSNFGDKMFKTIINFNTKIKEAASFGQPIGEYDPASKGKSDFRALADEVIAIGSKDQRKDLVNSLSQQLSSISTSADELIKATRPKTPTRTPITVTETRSQRPANPLVPVGSTTPVQQKPLQAIQPQSRPVATQIQNTATQTPTAKPAAPAQTVTPIRPATVQPKTNVPAAINPPTTTQPTPVAKPNISKPEDKTPAAQPARPKTQTVSPAALEKKLSDYYGVNQTKDAIVFVSLYPRAEKVQIAGDFNNWQPEKTELKKIGSTGAWHTKMQVPTGKYQYRLVVDGKWQQDPYNDNKVINPFGGFNSVLEVK